MRGPPGQTKALASSHDVLGMNQCGDQDGGAFGRIIVKVLP